MSNDSDKKNDLTRIEDLSEFFHEEDSDTDSLLEDSEDEQEQSGEDDLHDLDSLEQDDSFESDFSEDTEEADTEFSSSDDQDYNDSEESADFEQTESFETNFEEDDQSEPFEESTEEYSMDSESESYEQDSDDFSVDSNEDAEDYALPELPEDNTEDYQEEFNNDQQEDELPPPPDMEEDQFDSQEFSDSEETEDEFAQEETLEDTNEDYQGDFQEEDNEELHASEEQSDFPEESENTDSISEEDYDDNASIDLQDEPITPVADEEVETPEHSTLGNRESFSDVKQFANNMSYGTVKVGGNPAFSLLLRDIISDDSHEDIIRILNSHGLFSGEETLLKTSLELGHLLIAQISEYNAIFLAGKLRRFARDIQVGLAEQIHPSKSYEHDNRGMVTRRSILQNRDLKFKKHEESFNISDIATTTSAKIPDSKIASHIGVITSSGAYNLGELTQSTVEYEDGQREDESINSEEIYTDLLRHLKKKAYDKGANAIVSISYTINPIRSLDQSQDEEEMTQYQVICTGDAVIIERELDGE